MKYRGIHTSPIVFQFLVEQNGFVCCLQVHSSSQCGMQHLPQVLQVQICGSWRSLRLPFSSPSGWGVCWHSVPPAGAFGGCVRSQQEAGSAPLAATFTNTPSLVGAELLTGEEIPLHFRTISSPSGRAHVIQQMIFWKGKVHYGCGFNASRRHKCMRKMEGDDVSRERLVPIPVLLIKAPSLLGPRVCKQGRKVWGWEGQRCPEQQWPGDGAAQDPEGRGQDKKQDDNLKKDHSGKKKPLPVLGLFPCCIVFQKANFSYPALLVILLKKYDKAERVAFMFCPNTSVSWWRHSRLEGIILN